MKKDNDITRYTCPYCERIISSPSQKQAEFNYKLHRESCKQRNQNKEKN
jgi:hypothetical protein